MEVTFGHRMSACRRCGKEFERSRYYRPAIYCGDVCRKAARKEYDRRAYAKSGKERQRRSRLDRYLARCEQERG
jgi:hypothetical protein